LFDALKTRDGCQWQEWFGQGRVWEKEEKRIRAYRFRIFRAGLMTGRKRHFSTNRKKPNSSAGRRSSSKLFVGILLASILVVMIFAVISKGKVTAGVPIGKRPLDVALKDFAGKSVVIPDDVEGKVVFMHFWVSSCSYCVKEMCTLESFSRKHYAEGVRAFSINAGETRHNAMRYMENLKISYPILLDPDLSVARTYGVSGVPTTYILDRQGVLRFKILGEITSDKLDNIARTLL
jgi:cytochrome c biogenesis protein CcmG, thiol:disulfide interchange protein DsbE